MLDTSSSSTATNLTYPADYTIKHIGTNSSMSNNWVLYSTAAASGSCTLDFNDISADFTTKSGTISMNGTSSSQNKCSITFTYLCATGKSDCSSSGGSSCSTSGSAMVQLSSSAPSQCSFYVQTSSKQSVTTTPKSFSAGSVIIECSGYYAPTISGTCCSLTNCSVGSTTVTCSASWGSDSDTCVLSANSCANGWVGNNGDCCYSALSKSCCEASTQYFAGGTCLHTKGTFENGGCEYF